MGKYRSNVMHRYSNDLEKMRHADIHLEEALAYLRKCNDSDPVLPLIAGIRRIRLQMEIVFEAALPKQVQGVKK